MDAAEGGRPTGAGPMRALSFVVALAVSAVLLLDPYVLGPRLTWRIHAGLPLMMVGVSISFAYALGFKPDWRALQAAFHPTVGWLLLALGAAILAAG
jgi:predicted membrane protein